MKSITAGSFDRLTSLQALWSAWLRCRRGKRRQPRIARFDLDADTHVCRLYRRLRAGSYKPSPYRLKVVHDPKTRLVAAPSIEDRIVQNALLTDIGPAYESGFIAQTFACCTGRGPQRAVLEYLRWARRCRFRLSLDVQRYFASIHRGILLDLFARRLRDRDTLELIARLLSAGGDVYRTKLAIQTLGLESDPLPEGCGMPLGGYLSHWSGGLYLDGLDHFVKRRLKVRGYLRYMDDFTLFGDDRSELEDHREAIRDWLWAELRLELKRRRDGVQPTTQPSTFLGFRVSRSGISLGPKAKRRLKRRLKNVDTLGAARLVRGLRAYRGLLLSLA